MLIYLWTFIRLFASCPPDKKCGRRWERRAVRLAVNIAGDEMVAFCWIPLSRSDPAISTKLSKWGSSCLCWKTRTPKSSITPDFRPRRSPLSSFWILVSNTASSHLKGETTRGRGGFILMTGNLYQSLYLRILNVTLKLWVVY